tara:strand:- start:4882 stop:5874 length:993 start_codon:yes stop_codon:yes gene_type:complete
MSIRSKDRKILIIDCGGGTGNRLQNMINGFYFKEKYNYSKMYFAWRNQWSFTGRYEDFFEKTREFEVIEELDKDYPPSIWHSGNIFPKGYTQEDFTTIIPTNTPCMVHLMEGDINAIIKESDIFPQMGSPKALEIIKNHMPGPSEKVLGIVTDFMESNQLETDNYVGVHIRRTDKLGQGPADNYYETQISNILNSNPDTKFFICSDDPFVEKKLKQKFPENVTFRQKRPEDAPRPMLGSFEPGLNFIPYNKTLDEKLESICSSANTNPPEWWLEERTIKPGKQLYNAIRTEASVLDAIVDFFILSKSGRMLNSVGTFFAMASRISYLRKS